MINWLKRHKTITEPTLNEDWKDGWISFFPFFSAKSAFTNERIDEQRALKLSTVWACILIRQRTISSMPVHLKDNNKKIVSGSLNTIIHEKPNDFQTASIFYGEITTHLDLYGNAFVLINQEQNQVLSLTIINPKSVKIKFRNGQKIFIVKDRKDNQIQETEYSQDQIIHIIGLSLNGITGLSPIEYAANTIGDLLSLEKTYATAAKNGLKSIAVMETTELEWSKEQRKEFNENFKEYSKPENAGGIITLPIGRKLVPTNFLSLTPQSAQLLENKSFGIEEICRAFGVPPVLIGHSTKTSSLGKTLEEINQQFLTYSINPTLIAIEQAMMKSLFSIERKYRDCVIKFNRAALLQADMKTRLEAYEKAIRNSIYTPNEIRNWEDLPASSEENADKLRCEMNMTTIENLGKNNDE